MIFLFLKFVLIDLIFFNSVIIFSESIISISGFSLILFNGDFVSLYFISKCFATGKNLFCSIPFTISVSDINIILTANNFLR